MKYAVEFRDPRVQTIAESLFTPEQLRFQRFSKALPITPRDADARAQWGKILEDAEEDVRRARQMLMLTDMAVALNGGSYEKILKYADNAEDNPEGAK